MSDLPPTSILYPRGAPNQVPTRQIRDLSDGYFGLGRVFGINVVVFLLQWLLNRVAPVRSFDEVLVRFAVTVLLTALIFGFLTYGPNKKIGRGANWVPAQAVVASALMGLNSALCCGIVGYAVMQTIAGNHLKRYGIQMGFFATKRKVEAQIAAIEAGGFR